MKEIIIKVPDGKKPEWDNGVLKFVDDNKSITERIKTFDDAVKELGFDNELVKKYFNIVGSDTPLFSKNVYLKLRIIITALNEGWEPQFTKNENRYFPWFRSLTKEQYDNLTNSEKKHCVLFCNNTYSNYSFTYFRVYSDASHLFTVGTLRLALKTRELAEYAGKQFVDLWFDYLVN